MNKLSKFSITLALIVSLSGCELFQTTNTSLSVLTSAVNVKYLYETGKAVEFIDKANLSEQEVTKVLVSLEQTDKSREKLSLIEDNPSILITNLTEVILEYSKVKTAYQDIRYIVHNHWNEYSNEEKHVFLEMDTSVNILDKQFTDFLKAKENNQALQSVLVLANTILRISSMM